jgi:hypothetical protein
MQGMSAFLGFSYICLIGLTIVAIRDDYLYDALDLLGWSFVPLTLVLGFTWPTRCRVKTSRGRPCKGEAYGFLFGCSRYGHWWSKFFARIGLQKDALRYTEHHASSEGRVSMAQFSSKSEPIRVTVADNGLGVCGFWVGLVSAVASVIQVITSFTVH